MRVTPQRLAVLEVVSSTPEHLCAEQVYLKVRQKLPSISLATVYKALGELREAGTVRALPVSGKLRYDGPSQDEHHHLVCDRCRRVEDVRPGSGFTKPELSAEAKLGFEILGAEITFRGICPECRAKVAAAS